MLPGFIRLSFIIVFTIAEKLFPDLKG